MAWWVYKCNSKPQPYARAYGNFDDFFSGKHGDRWGSTKWTPEIARAKRGDIIIAYQVNRNELVGIARVIQSCDRDTYLHLKAITTIRFKVRPLRKSNPKIAAIPAFKPGRIQTIYEITDSDAQMFLKAVGVPQKLLSRLQTATRTSDEETFVEGLKRTVARAERNARLRMAAKEKWGMKCYCCGFDFEQFYGSMARGAAVVHHLELFTANDRKRKTTVEDVRVVCANCHYVLHLTKSPMGVDDLKKVVSKSWRRWSDNGYERKG